MRNQQGSLNRAKRIFSLKAKIHEIELGKSRRKLIEAQATHAGLERSLASVLVASLSAHAAGCRLYAECDQQLKDAEAGIAKQTECFIDHRIRERLCHLLAGTIEYRQARADTEKDITELVAIVTANSLRQGETD